MSCVPFLLPDGLGRVVRDEDALGRATTSTFDDAATETATGSVKQVHRPNGENVYSLYDSAADQLKQSDKGNFTGNATTQWTYDPLARQVLETTTIDVVDEHGRRTPKDVGRHWSYQGLTTVFTDRNERETTTTANPVQRTQTESANQFAATFTLHSDGSTRTAEESVTDPAHPFESKVAFAYDAYGRAVTVDNAGTTLVPHVLLTNTLDADGNRMRLDDSLGGVATAAYDLADESTQITQFGTGVTPKQVNLSYNAAGQFASIDRSQGWTWITQANYSHDSAGRLLELRHSSLGDTLQAGYTLGYDLDSRINSVTMDSAAVGNKASSFGYDAVGQVTNATGTLTPGESYSYDQTGNRKSSQSGTDSHSYSSGKGNRLFADGQFAYTYDDEGNLTRKTVLVGSQATGETTFYTWDSRNRLTHVERRASPSVNDSGERTGTMLMSADYAYDVFNLRIAKTVDPDGAGPQPASRESYVYDGGQIIQEFLDPNTSDDSQSPDPTPAQLVRRNLYGPAVDQILAVEQFDLSTLNGQPSTVLWPLTDWQGSVRDLVQLSPSTSQPVVAKHLDYDSFGNTTRVTDGSGQPSTLDIQPSTRFLYTGREFDTETGLQYNRARYYNSQTGRWLSEDPIGFGAGDANLYRYVGNNAINASDPNGLFQQPNSQRDIRKGKSLLQQRNNELDGVGVGPLPAVPGTPDEIANPKAWRSDGTQRRLERGVVLGVATGALITEATPVLAEQFFLGGLEGEAVGVVFKAGGKVFFGLCRKAGSFVFTRSGKAIAELAERKLAKVAEQIGLEVSGKLTAEAVEGRITQVNNFLDRMIADTRSGGKVIVDGVERELTLSRKTALEALRDSSGNLTGKYTGTVGGADVVLGKIQREVTVFQGRLDNFPVKMLDKILRQGKDELFVQMNKSMTKEVAEELVTRMQGHGFVGPRRICVFSEEGEKLVDRIIRSTLK